MKQWVSYTYYLTSQGRGDTVIDRQVPGTDSSYGVVPLPFPSLPF